MTTIDNIGNQCILCKLYFSHDKHLKIKDSTMADVYLKTKQKESKDE